MLEYFTYKKVKKHREEKKAKEEAEKVERTEPSQDAGSAKTEGVKEDLLRRNKSKRHDQNGQRRPEDISRSDSERPRGAVLDREDEEFLSLFLSDDGPAPPLPERPKTPELEWLTDTSDVDIDRAGSKKGKGKDKDKAEEKGKEKEKAKGDKKPNRISLLFSKHKKGGDTLKPEDAQVTEAEVKREEADINNVLDRLNLSAKNNAAVPLTKESSELLQKFTQIFKDLANGVPTAYDDLVGLIKDRDGAITKGFEKLPGSLQKLVMQLPEKITNSLGPEILAAAAKSQGINAKSGAGLKDTAQSMFMPQNLLELLTKPGALVGMLRAIVTALKTRWPAFIGVNVLWSVALFRKSTKTEPTPPSKTVSPNQSIKLKLTIRSFDVRPVVLLQARPGGAPRAGAARQRHRGWQSDRGAC